LEAVSVIVPAYNESAAVGAQVIAVRQALHNANITHEIIVVDDGSDDGTADQAHGAGARVLRHLKNRGYGASLKTGILVAQYDTIAILDADGTYPADQIPALLKKLETADMAVGARTGATVHIPLVRQPGKLLLGWLATQIAGQPIPDLNSGLRIFRRECALQYFPILSNQFSFTTTITLAFLADDYHIVYHPIDYYRRVGKSKILPHHFMDFIVLVLRMAMLFQPLKVFLPLSAASGILGVLKVAFDAVAVFERHIPGGPPLLFEPLFSTSALLLLMLSVQLLLIGMVADGVLRRIAQHNRRLVPSRGVIFREVVAGDRQANAPDAES
jgi:glycosyltransferase involved in cell wall biosynthesis